MQGKGRMMTYWLEGKITDSEDLDEMSALH